MKDRHGVLPVSAKMTTLLSVLAALSTVACGDNDETNSVMKPGSTGAAPTEIATLTLANGNTVTFYDARGVSVS
jgi:plastocyanin